MAINRPILAFVHIVHNVYSLFLFLLPFLFIVYFCMYVFFFLLMLPFW